MDVNKEFEKYHRRLFPDYDAFMAAIKRPDHKSIRVNTLKVDRERVTEFLEKTTPPTGRSHGALTASGWTQTGNWTA